MLRNYGLTAAWFWDRKKTTVCICMCIYTDKHGTEYFNKQKITTSINSDKQRHQLALYIGTQMLTYTLIGLSACLPVLSVSPLSPWPSCNGPRMGLNQFNRNEKSGEPASPNLI